jgi:hypothetical protein
MDESNSLPRRVSTPAIQKQIHDDATKRQIQHSTLQLDLQVR